MLSSAPQGKLHIGDSSLSTDVKASSRAPMSRELSGLLDCLRWLSAVLVVVTHTANLMVARWADTPVALRSPIQLLWTFLGGFGHQSVMTFYVLSGFLVGGPLIAEVRRCGSAPWFKYSIDRLVRIYLVLIPALAACFVLDHIGFRFAPEIMGEFVHGHTSWFIFLGNLANLQNFFVVFFGSNGPIGTLAMEMWFYISLPLFLFAWCTAYGRIARISFSLLGLAITIVLVHAQPAYLPGLVIWLIGAHARLSEHPRFRRLGPPAVLLVITLIAIRATMRRSMSSTLWVETIADLVLALVLHLLLVTARHTPDRQRGMLFSPVHKWMASFSYSLYATHMPLLFLLTILSRHWFGFGVVDVVTHSWQWLLVVAVVLLTCGFAFLFSRLTEAKTSALRRWIFARLGENDWGLRTAWRR
jgi:peptidoglycan/LPS O-acetylase OafA/YrhL